MSHGLDRVSRREFVLGLGAGALGWSVSGLASEAPPTLTSRGRLTPVYGIQVGAVSFADEGVERVLDIFQEQAHLNALFLTTFTYGRGLAGRQVPGQPFPDHGSQASDQTTFYGGHYGTPHPQFYPGPLQARRAPDAGGADMIAEVLPEARKRGMQVFCSIEDVFRSDLPEFEEVAEVDLYGRKAGTLCLVNPQVRAFWTGLATDICRSYDVDGVLFFNERNGPLLNALGASHAQSIASSRVTCFCAHHQAMAHNQGLDFERVREGYRRLDHYVQASMKGERPSDGYFVEFWRILADNPEILMWDRLFDQAKHAVLQDVRTAVKGVRETLQVGFHIEHVNSFNPIFRATRQYADLARKADFLKVVVYNNCGGERYARFIENIGSTVFRDVPKGELLQFNNHLLNYSAEASLDELAKAGLSPDYVARETRRALDGVGGACRILPGIDIGIPTGRNSRKASTDDTYAATKAALQAGAHGLILSRKYSEMPLANLAAAGRAIQEFARS